MPRPPESIYARSHALIPPQTRRLKVLVIGAGMVGSWVAAALTRMVHEVTLVDYDTVESVNVGVQLYNPHDIGMKKVAAVARHLEGLPLKAVDDDFELLGDDFRWADYDIIVSALDSMSGRAKLWEQFMNSPMPDQRWVDVRVMGELVCVLTAESHDLNSRETYAATLVPDSDIEDTPCGAEGTVYSGMFSGARVAAVINNWARGIPVAGKEVWHTGLMQHLDAVQEDKLADVARAHEHQENREEFASLGCPECQEKTNA